MSRERKRKRDQRRAGGCSITIGGVKHVVMSWEGEGTEIKIDDLTGQKVPVDHVVSGSHRETVRTPIPTDRN